MRQYMRHPSELPVELAEREQRFLPKMRLHNISLGGVACNSNRAFRRGPPSNCAFPCSARRRVARAWSPGVASRPMTT